MDDNVTKERRQEKIIYNYRMLILLKVIQVQGCGPTEATAYSA